MISWRCANRLGAALWFAVAGGMAHAATPELRLVPSVGGPQVDLARARRHRAAVLLFWRTDCAPCLLELEHLSELRRAAGSERLLLVAVQPREELDRGLRRLRRPVSSWRAVGDPAAVLARFGGAPPRLPLAVALDARGSICRIRHGLIGTKTVTQWMRACE